MVRATNVARAIALGLLATSSEAARIRIRQPQATSSSPTAADSSSTTAAPSTTSTQDVPQALLSIADSLMSENYPSQTIVNIRTLSFPTTVVIGTHTYTFDPTQTSETSSTPTAQTTDSLSKTHAATNAKETEAKSTPIGNGSKDDKRLAIIIGAVVGVAVLALLGLVFFCLHRRKKDNGSFFLRRSTPSMRSNGSWMPDAQRPDTFGTTTYVSAAGAPSNMHQHKYPQMAVVERGNTPPMNTHPAYSLHDSSRSNSDENPFYTPQERSMVALNTHELDGQAISQLDHAEPANRRSSSSMRNSRPPTPFSPLMMTQMPSPSARPETHQNPFASAEDEEADDVVSPIMPPIRNPERRYSPMVHYPSWDEVSAFSFSGSEREARQEDGGDGWRPELERKHGRHELA